MRKTRIILWGLFLIFIFFKQGFSLGPGDVTISMDFKEVSLKDVLKIFSQQSGLNFVASNEIEDRKITLYFENVSVEDALNTILRANNLTYEQPAGSNIIVIQELLMPEVETITRIYTLNYAKADSVKELFEKMREKRQDATAAKEKEEKSTRQPIKAAGLLTEYGKIVSDTRTNSLIITDIPAQFPVIEETLAKLDEATPQVMIEAELLETTVGTINKLGVEWADTIGVYTGPVQTTKFPFRKHDFPSGVDKTEGMAYGTISLADFTAALKLLESDSETKVLARPRVLTLNNETAEINLTAQTAVAGITTIQGEIQTYSVERIQTGIVLKATPQVNKDGYITMTLEPSVTTPVKSPYFTKAEYVDPHKREVKTTVRVKDGDTIVIGGLISTQDTETLKKVPVLGDIPLLGYLFKNKSKDKSDRELIVFITPHISQEYTSPTLVEGLEREITVPPGLPKEKAIDATLDKFNQ
ncbi:MAG: secretin and TonB N-terminal domain-containing protein [Candidatus Omnitrophica bacterium]|nr:secretin and TonB N-terminal domain-containing protein [Candidatus Omnitrophota bacterium]